MRHAQRAIFACPIQDRRPFYVRFATGFWHTVPKLRVFVFVFLSVGWSETRDEFDGSAGQVSLLLSGCCANLLSCSGMRQQQTGNLAIKSEKSIRRWAILRGSPLVFFANTHNRQIGPFCSRRLECSNTMLSYVARFIGLPDFDLRRDRRIIKSNFPPNLIIFRPWQLR